MSLTSLFPIQYGVQVGVWQIDEPTAELEALLVHPELYAAKTTGLKPDSQRLREILAVRCLVKAMVGEELPIAYDEAGHPFLPAGKGQVSITHTKGFAAIIYVPEIFSAGRLQIGIDMEHIGRRVGRVAERFLMPDELALLDRSELEIGHVVQRSIGCRQMPESVDPLSLHLAWSAKETAYKVLGTSYYDLQHKTTLIAVDAEAGHLFLRAEGIARPLAVDYVVTPDYVLTYAVWVPE